MIKLKARFIRFLWLLNPVHLFQGWCAFTGYDKQGRCGFIGAVNTTDSRLKTFWMAGDDKT